MKRLFTTIIILACFFCKAQDHDLKVKFKIDHVTVFLDGAQITRQGTVSLKPGVSMLALQGIAPGIQEQSIQVEAPAGVKILSVSFNVNYLEEIKASEKIAALLQEKIQITTSLAQEKSLEEVYREEESILKTNKSIGGTEKGVPIEELKKAMDYFRQRLIDIKQQLQVTDQNIRKHNERILKIDAQLKELSAIKAQPVGQIVVKVSTKTSINAGMSIKYLVKEARWFPSYDIRAKDIKSPISVTYKANISQHSGEKWENVRLTISSGNPLQTGAKPIINPWMLGFNNTVVSNNSATIGMIQPDKIYEATNNMVRGRILDDTGEGLPGVNVIIKGTTIGTVTDAAGYYSIPLTTDATTLVFSFVGYKTEEVVISGRNEIEMQLSPDVAQLSEVVVTGYDDDQAIRIRGSNSVSRQLSGRLAGVETHSPRVKKAIVATPVIRQTNVEFTLDELFSIDTDGEHRSTDMVEYELDALFEYYCVPKLDPDAFLVAKLMNWDEYNFLEGEASLFFEGKYIGKSVLDTRNTSDTLSLSLGRDRNVMVTREKKKDYTSRQIIGAYQKSTVAYEIIIRNKKSEQLTIVIEDQIPVTTDKMISIDKIEDSDAMYDERTGLLKWRKQIGTGQTKTIHLRYDVRFPKNSVMLLE
ncbi:DUF4139 domain-containing protein [Chryseolinea sp. H1M3-3]|uniref:DUF4139 domain-containing protein n=1 Tax=Chryseolinea sp. H1M3-3 TaxID=3034144 RepID=UPI0023EDDD86|nr:DUF4139 domain-containing protein [Chryseolinea sp. H1M3-3]